MRNCAVSPKTVMILGSDAMRKPPGSSGVPLVVAGALAAVVPFAAAEIDVAATRLARAMETTTRTRKDSAGDYEPTRVRRHNAKTRSRVNDACLPVGGLVAPPACER